MTNELIIDLDFWIHFSFYMCLSFEISLYLMFLLDLMDVNKKGKTEAYKSVSR